MMQTKIPEPPMREELAADGNAAALLADPKWSAAAITGFVLSFLLVLAPLGVLTGIVGVVRTRGRRRRGMGLAIAAIAIGLVVSLGTGLLGLGVVMVYRAGIVASDATAVLKTSSVTVPQKAAEFYDHSARRFQLAVSPEAFESWLAGVVKEHGSLVSVKKPTHASQFEPRPDGTWVFNFTGDFVNGAASIAVGTASPSFLHPQVVDLTVDGISVIETPEFDAGDTTG